MFTTACHHPHTPELTVTRNQPLRSLRNYIMTTSNNGQLDEEAFERGFLELRITPRADGRSPAQVLFGHPLRSGVPTHHCVFAPEWQQAADECDAKYNIYANKRNNVTTAPLVNFMVYPSVLGSIYRTTPLTCGTTLGR